MDRERLEEAMDQAQEETGITDEQIAEAVAAGATPGAPATKKVAPKKEEETEGEVVDEEEEEEAEEEPEQEEEEPEGPDNAPIPRKRFNKVYREKKEMERYLQGLLKERDMLLTALDTIREEQEQRPRRQVKEEPEPEPDWDSMTPAELAKSLTTRIVGAVREELADTVKTQIEPVKTSAAREKTRAALAQCQKDHADFMDYLPEMTALAKMHPTLSPEEVYKLAKGDTKAVTKSVAARMKKATDLKKKGKVETHSSPTTTTSTVKRVKSWKEVGRKVAEEMGM